MTCPLQVIVHRSGRLLKACELASFDTVSRPTQNANPGPNCARLYRVHAGYTVAPTYAALPVDTYGTNSGRDRLDLVEYKVCAMRQIGIRQAERNGIPSMKGQSVVRVARIPLQFRNLADLAGLQEEGSVGFLPHGFI